jgi:hypothetical protein
MTYQMPPGPQPRPIIGNLLEFRKDQLGFATHMQH